MKNNATVILFMLVVLLGSTGPVLAQWQTQSILIKPGWTAVYLFVDASYATLDTLVGSDPANPIQEVWLWEPTFGSAQFVNNPLSPTTGSSQWANWERAGSGQPPGTLASLAPNSAYLIHSTATTNYTWDVKGQPATPRYAWSTSDINLVGFRTITNTPPNLAQFLGLAPSFQSAATIYQYTGGKLGPNNPVLVTSPQTVPVLRGQAFWINETNFVNNYFGPFQVVVNGTTVFGASGGSASIRLLNVTASPVTVNLTLQPSESPPVGQASIAGVPPLIVQGALNPVTLTYAISNLSATTPMSWTLAPQGQSGSDIAVTLGVNRAALTSSPGALYAGILRFTDSSGYTEVDVPASARVGSFTGLWVGDTAITNVSSYLKTYQTNNDGTLAQYPPGTTNAGAYVVSGVNTSPGATASAYPMRLILHNDGTNVNLLQRVFYGSDVNSNAILSTVESALDPKQLATARRISAVAFPWTPNNQAWRFSGQLGPNGSLSTTVTVAYDDQAANPFLHTYHPDHDNLDATFQQELPIGAESYQIDRAITLTLEPPGNDFNSLVHYGQALSGFYSEAITLTGIGRATRTFNVSGWFTLNRLSPIATLAGAY